MKWNEMKCDNLSERCPFGLSFFLPRFPLPSASKKSPLLLILKHSYLNANFHTSFLALDTVTQPRCYTFILIPCDTHRISSHFMIYILRRRSFFGYRNRCFMDRLKMLICVSAWPIRIYFNSFSVSKSSIFYFIKRLAVFSLVNFTSEWPVSNLKHAATTNAVM